MAIMIPGMQYKDLQKDFNGSVGELRLYELLEQLPNDFYVLHSTSWNEQRRRNELSPRKYVQWGEADFTVYHPEKGIIVFEVKDGLISYSRERGWIQTNRKTGATSSIDPMAQAEKSKYYFRDQIFKPAFDGMVPFTFCSAVWFTSGDRNLVTGNLPLNYKEETTLWANDLASVEQVQNAINRVFKYHDAYCANPSQELTSKTLDLLAPEFGLIRSIHSRAIANETLFHLMTREQNRLLEYLDEQQTAAIHGAAGTGKTIMAIEKAKRMETDGPVLLLCFNRFLMEHIREELSDNHPNISVFTIDGLYTKLSGGLPHFDSADDRNDAILEVLMDWKSLRWNYKHIIIDEGQDFFADHLQLLGEIAEEKDGCFYVFYDKNQFIQGQEYPEWLDHAECRLVLSHNCRNTHEIALTSTRPIALPEKRIRMNPFMERAEQPKPKLFFVSDNEALQEYVLKLIRKYSDAKYKKSDIVLLSMKAEGCSALERENMIPELAAICSDKRQTNKVLFTTVRKFKGLEADVVICIDVDEDTFTNETNRSLFYVGTSRAKTWLDIVTTTSQEALANAITGDDAPRKRPQAVKAVRDALCVKIGTVGDLIESKNTV